MQNSPGFEADAKLEATSQQLSSIFEKRVREAVVEVLDGWLREVESWHRTAHELEGVIASSDIDQTLPMKKSNVLVSILQSWGFFFLSHQVEEKFRLRRRVDGTLIPLDVRFRDACFSLNKSAIENLIPDLEEACHQSSSKAALEKYSFFLSFGLAALGHLGPHSRHLSRSSFPGQWRKITAAQKLCLATSDKAHSSGCQHDGIHTVALIGRNFDSSWQHTHEVRKTIVYMNSETEGWLSALTPSTRRTLEDNFIWVVHKNQIGKSLLRKRRSTRFGGFQPTKWYFQAGQPLMGVIALWDLIRSDAHFVSMHGFDFYTGAIHHTGEVQASFPLRTSKRQFRRCESLAAHGALENWTFMKMLATKDRVIFTGAGISIIDGTAGDYANLLDSLVGQARA